MPAARGGIPEIVDHRVNGLLVPPNQVEDLADALVRLLSEKKTCEEMGSAGRQRALAEFQEEIYVDRFLDLYRKMAAHSDRVDTHGSRRTWSGSGGFKTESMSIERLLNYGESA